MNETASNWPVLVDSDPSERFPRNLQNLQFQYLLLDQLPVGVFQKDREGRFTFVNSWFCRLKKAAVQEYLGKTADEVADAKGKPSDGSNTEQIRRYASLREGAKQHKQIVDTGQIFESEEFYRVGMYGKEQHLHIIKGPIFGPDGTIVGSQGILLDITERKRAEAQLASERDLLRALMESSNDAIYFKDRESRFLRCSSAMAQLFKLSSVDELIGKCDFDFFEKDRAQEFFNDEQEIIRTGRPVIGKTDKEIRLDGRVTWALSSKMPLYNARGEIIGTFGINKDITAFKEAESKVEALHKQLLQTSRQAGMAEVATSVLHNVGNVLNSANVSATLLLANAKKSNVAYLAKAVALLKENAANLASYLSDDPKGKLLPAYLDQVCEQLTKEQQCAIQELESLGQNIDHIKEIVAMQQNYAKVFGVAETVSVTDLVEDAVRMNAGALTRHEVKLVRDYAPVPQITVEKHKVLQILVNLIRNAKYACDESGRKDKQLRVKISQHDQWVCIAIIDNGIGIPKENRKLIFNHGFTTRRDGHGFGLHSGALAATELGGTLTAHSEGHDLGATFTLELPLQPPQHVSCANN